MVTMKKWSRDVTQGSHALDVEEGLFASRDPKHIAHSLKASAERSAGTPFQSAMSTLTAYINRDNLPDAQKAVLEKARDELRLAFGKV